MIALSRTGQSPVTSIRGFTLIEVIIVVVVVSVLMAIGLPAYENSVQKSRRADAKSALMDAANRQEKHMLDQGTYTDDMEELGFGDDPLESEEGYYTVDAVACTGGTLARCYVLTANPATGSPQTDDLRCTQFVLESNGSKTASGSDQDNCW
ncbi:MAG: type IV pilin protein [Pseudomonadota bacterium]